uniref:Putative secreted protein n=1 Tax=Anopheles darlingi TaxID=43151 RepID=A0A2M4D116_ANODA
MHAHSRRTTSKDVCCVLCFCLSRALTTLHYNSALESFDFLAYLIYAAVAVRSSVANVLSTGNSNSTSRRMGTVYQLTSI